MLKTLVILPDGAQLTSGEGIQGAIESCELTECVNSGQELTLGSCCANMLRLRIFDPGGVLQIHAGEELEVRRQTQEGQVYPVGLFTAEKPTRPTANILQITAYDRVTRLDKDLTGWLAGLEGWPYTLLEMAEMVCRVCGLQLKNTELPNGGYPVRRFTAEGVTGRLLMQWIGEATGRFCRATDEGKIEFAWYTPAQDVEITPGKAPAEVRFRNGELKLQAEDITAQYDGQGALTLESSRFSGESDGQGNVTLWIAPRAQTLPFYQNGLTFEDYQVSPVEKVQIRGSEEDVGAVYPDGLEGSVNTYVIRDNPLLSAFTGEELLPVAEVLYELLSQVRYTPCKVALPADLRIRAGSILQITDRNGKVITAYVMTRTQKGQKDTLECTGNPGFLSTTAVNNRLVTSVQGKLLKLRTDVEGLLLENTDRAGKLTKVEADLEGIRGQVNSQSVNLANVQEQMTAVNQTAQGLQITVKRLENDGVSKLKTAMGYTFDDAGLQISKEGQQMKNLLDNTGMYVTRSGEPLLLANEEGVTAVDVRVNNYLIVGKHARFEDHMQGRTACYWLGG